ncbi:DUF2750 domain-containing protein [Romboutsia lituseburensis]|uniref:Immunity protein 26 n=1 Tax=Romboutsia lituseburensis DSM 797 TaxID=1121325 RepID=A0A1G9PL07_9FIRM|nr:DUF2750 domain-containing protein [Romboutsia lituseburensis]CEH33436.1 Immunity protein 14 [Romboutsia lituseburensis]SDL99516.1 Immunity protein 26 [Romboutsia lituseburensis DSM 797]
MIKRRKRPKDGDIFTIEIKEGLYSYGQVIDKEYNLYLIYDILGDENKSIEEVIKSPKMLLTRSFNYSFRDGDWKIVGNAQIPEDLNIPMFKMGVDSKYHVVNYKWDVIRKATREEGYLLHYVDEISPGGLEEAIMAKYEMAEWNYNYDYMLYPPKYGITYKDVLQMSESDKYRYFNTTVAYYEELWGLYDDGWATIEGDEGVTIPLWPDKQYADICAKGDWETYTAKRIDLYEFLNKWVPEMEKDNIKPAVFWVNEEAVIVDADFLQGTLILSLEEY